MHLVFGKLKLAVPNIFISEKFYFLEPYHLRADENVAARMRIRRISHGCGEGLGLFEYADLRVADGVGVVVDVHSFDIGLALLEIEMLDVVLLPAVDVDGFFVQENQRARKVYFADDVWRASDINDDEVVAAD